METIDIICTAQFVTQEETRSKQPFLYINQVLVVMRSGLTSMPRSILPISIWIFYIVFELHMHTNGKPAFLIPISDKLWPLLYFFGSFYRPHLSDTNHKEGRLSICCLVLDQHRVKKHVQIRKIEWSIAKQRLWPHLGWSSSLLRRLIRLSSGQMSRRKTRTKSPRTPPVYWHIAKERFAGRWSLGYRHYGSSSHNRSE